MIDMCLCSHCARIFPQKELREYSMPMLHSTLPSRDMMADKSKDIELGKINTETLPSVEEEALNKIPASNLSLSPTPGILNHNHAKNFYWYPRRCLCAAIIPIAAKDLVWGNNDEAAYYIWGWPGPDYNIYSRGNYREDWAFTKREMEKIVNQ